MNKLRIAELRKVESSNLDLVGFDGDKTFIKFKNGKLYEYPNTTKEEFLGLVNAESVGKAFFKSYKSKQEFSQLEDTVLEQKKADEPVKELTLLEELEGRLVNFQKAGNAAGVRAMKLFKAELIKNSKAKKPLDEVKVGKQYLAELNSEKDAYMSAGKNAKGICYEILLVEALLPKEPPKMSDEDVQTAVLLHIGSQEYTMKDMGAIIRYLKVTLGDQNAPAIAKFTKEALNG